MKFSVKRTFNNLMHKLTQWFLTTRIKRVLVTTLMLDISTPTQTHDDKVELFELMNKELNLGYSPKSFDFIMFIINTSRLKKLYCEHGTLRLNAMHRRCLLGYDKAQMTHDYQKIEQLVNQ